MSGLWRSACDELWCLEEAQCCTAEYPAKKTSSEECDWKDITTSFDSRGWAVCPDNKYMAGLHRSGGVIPWGAGLEGNSLDNIEKLWCCGAADAVVTNCESKAIT